jgi:hypothetical protein
VDTHPSFEDTVLGSEINLKGGRGRDAIGRPIRHVSFKLFFYF